MECWDSLGRGALKVELLKVDLNPLVGKRPGSAFCEERRFNEDHLKVNVHWQTCPSGLRKTWIIFLTFLSSFGSLCMSLSYEVE